MSTAGICWHIPPVGAPRALAPTEAIRIGTLYGPWPTVLQFLGRAALAAAAYYVEYRTAPSAPDGWAAPVVGVDDQGQPAAVRVPLDPPAPPPPDPLARETALAELAGRIEAEFMARLRTRAGSLDEWVYRTARATALLAARQAGTATPDELAELAGLLAMQQDIQTLRAYAWQPTQPSMWGPAPAAVAGTLYGWAAASALTAAEIALIDPAAPPVTAPQWPVVG